MVSEPLRSGKRCRYTALPLGFIYVADCAWWTGTAYSDALEKHNAEHAAHFRCRYIALPFGFVYDTSDKALLLNMLLSRTDFGGPKCPDDAL